MTLRKLAPPPNFAPQVQKVFSCVVQKTSTIILRHPAFNIWRKGNQHQHKCCIWVTGASCVQRKKVGPSWARIAARYDIQGTHKMFLLVRFHRCSQLILSSTANLHREGDIGVHFRNKCEFGSAVRVHTRYKNGSCEIIQQFFETFGHEKSCMIEQEPFLQCVNSLLPQ